MKKTRKPGEKDSENPQNQVCAKRMVLRFCDQHFSWVLLLYVTAADLMVGKLKHFQGMTEFFEAFIYSRLGPLFKRPHWTRPLDWVL